MEWLAFLDIQICYIEWLETMRLISCVVCTCISSIFPCLLKDMLTNYSSLRWLIWMRFIVQGLLFALRVDWYFRLCTTIRIRFLSSWLSRTVPTDKVIEHLEVDLDKSRCERIWGLRWVTGSIAWHLGFLHRCRNFLASSLLTSLFSLRSCRRNF